MPMQLVHTSDVVVSSLAKKAVRVRVCVCVCVSEREREREKEREYVCVCAPARICVFGCIIFLNIFIYECMNVIAYEDKYICICRHACVYVCVNADCMYVYMHACIYT